MNNDPKIIVFTCNWEAYSALENVGAARQGYPAGVRILRLPCLGSIDTTNILEALRIGADGVLLLACPESRCHYESGSLQAERTFNLAIELLQIAGIPSDRVQFHRMPFDGTEPLIQRLRAFESQLRMIIGSEVTTS